MNLFIEFISRAAIGLLILIAIGASITPSDAAELYGPYNATVDRVIDGDTVKLHINVWPHETKSMSVRIDGVNAPEKSPRWKCSSIPATKSECMRLKKCEKVAGVKAALFVQSLLKPGQRVQVHKIKNGKFAGRVIGDIYTGDGFLSKILVNSGHARSYNGGKRSAWCAK